MLDSVGVTPAQLDSDAFDHLGLERHVDVALRLHIPREQAVVAARTLGTIIDDIDGFAARVVGLETTTERTDITLAVSLGSTEQIRAAENVSIRAVRGIHRITEQMSAYAPALVAMPSAESSEARAAARLVEGDDTFAWIATTV